MMPTLDQLHSSLFVAGVMLVLAHLAPDIYSVTTGYVMLSLWVVLTFLRVAYAMGRDAQ